MGARLIQVIETDLLRRGKGTEEDPVRLRVPVYLEHGYSASDLSAWGYRVADRTGPGLDYAAAGHVGKEMR